MQIYLPIAEMSVNIFLILGMGASVGVLSGLFGVGGGFLMTPLLIFIGIPPTVAVSTESNQILANSVSGVLAHWRRGNVDFRMGSILSIGGFVGSVVGVIIFQQLRQNGQIELVISLCYVFFLGTIGCFMGFESIQSIINKNKIYGASKLWKMKKPLRQKWIRNLPFKIRFRESKLYISAILPVSIGFIVGILAAIMGIGGGFVMVPAMIYLLGMPTNVVVGTSLFNIIFVTANTTFLQATINQTVDIVLAVLLLSGGVIGAQIGARLISKIQNEYLRGLLAIIVIIVCAKLIADLIVSPSDNFSFGIVNK